MLLAAVGQAAPAGARNLPDSYVVSRDPGILPEGIAVEHDGTIYVTSKGTGRLFKGHISDPELRPLAAQGIVDRPSALGVHSDARHRIFSVGGSVLTVHDRSGRLVARRTAQDGPLGAANLNDLVITEEAVYVTDWANPVIHRADLHAGHLGPLRPWVDIRSAAPHFPAQYWLLNGITADRTGRTLLVASNGTEAVWRVNTDTKAVEEVRLGGQSFGADGMLLRGRHLYAVLNYGAPAGVYIAKLSKDLRNGTVEYQITGDRFDLPTTLARNGCRLYVVNSQLDDPPGHPPYTVSAISDPTCR
ncbi:hypothetical protein ACF06P_30655 [Streptomyces sp. NPDC015684]|uniref:hypothetical protein n=1 Tax=unclassified Streptomyces TaxID=2593676 RepID=UPI0036FF8A49